MSGINMSGTQGSHRLSGGGVSGPGAQLRELVRAHVSGNDVLFFNVATRLAAELTGGDGLDLAVVIAEARRGGSLPSSGSVRAIERPRRDETAELFVERNPDVRLDALTLPLGLLQDLYRVIAEHRSRTLLGEHGYQPIRRVLLTGPPGTGKTLSAAALAAELGLPLRTARLDAVISRYMGDTASKLRLIFNEMARTSAVYLFDEFDALGGERGMGNDVGEARRMLNSLLLFLEDVPSDSLLLAATNHPQLLDQALFRRFDLTCGYMLPTPQDSVTVLRSALQKMGTDSIDWGGLGDETAGLSHAELVKAAEDAAKAALLAGSTMVEEHSLRAALRHRRGVAGAAQLSP